MSDATDLAGTYRAKHRFFFGGSRPTVHPGGLVTLSHAEASVALAKKTVHPERVVESPAPAPAAEPSAPAKPADTGEPKTGASDPEPKAPAPEPKAQEGSAKRKT